MNEYDRNSREGFDAGVLFGYFTFAIIIMIFAISFNNIYLMLFVTFDLIFIILMLTIFKNDYVRGSV